MSSVRNYADPRNQAGLYVGPHVIIIAIIAAIVLFAAGAFAGSRYTAAYFAQHYRATQPIAAVGAPLRVTAPALAGSGSIRMNTYPGVGNQDGTGSCAAYATAWALSYEYRIAHPGSWLRFSPRCMYDHYSDTYNGGSDGGSWPDQDAEQIPSLGIAKFKQVPNPPYGVDNPEPAACYNTSYRFPVSFATLDQQAGGGVGLVTLIKEQILAGSPVLVGLPVYPEYDNATATGGLVTSPKPGESSRGGHENVIIAYNDLLRFPDGTTGGVEVQNQWTRQWGVQGRAWLSYDFVGRYVFGVEVPHINNQLPAADTTGVTRFVPNHAPKHLLPTPTKNSSRPGAFANTWYVHGVVTHDTHVDVTALFNYWGDYYHVWPVGLVATAATESGLNQYADRCCTPGDTSYGMMQFTLGTACGYGVCADIRDWLDTPSNAIALAARYYHDAAAQTCLTFPTLYTAYNEGAGYGCNAAEYLYPQGVAYQNFTFNFLPNFRVVQAVYEGGGPAPTPKPVFAAAAWNAYTAGHHLRAIPYRYHHGLSWAASVWQGHMHYCRGVVHTGRYYAHGGYTRTPFAACAIYAWPRYHTAKVARR